MVKLKDILIWAILIVAVEGFYRKNRWRNVFNGNKYLDLTNSTLCPSDKCEIQSKWTQQEICDYVNCNDGSCEGGGYLLWSQYVECAGSNGTRIVLIIIGVIYMLMLFVMVSQAADNFFSPAISSIVAHLRISESVAGVTFMAFGNGAPDVFGSIASVLSSRSPKADLALGELFGGGLFVTTMVVSTIILTSPFDVEIFSTVRDLIFYITAVLFLAFCFIFSNQVYLWMPIVFLGIYCIYVCTVIGIQLFHTRKRKELRKQSSARSRKSVGPVQLVVQDSPPTPPPTVQPDVHIITDAIDRLKGHVENNIRDKYKKRASFAFTIDGLLNPRHPYAISPHNLTPGSLSTEEDEEFIVIHGQVFHGQEARSRAASIVPEPMKIDSWKSWKVLYDLWEHLRPLPPIDEWEELGIISKVLCIITIPTLVFKITIPLNETSWSKPLTFIHCCTCPMFVLFAIQLLTLQPFDGSPGLWLYGLILSGILVTFVAFFTELGVQPKYYKEVYSYTGFLMSVAWIYLLSSEVVNVVTMLGVVSRISHEILGLTILAWSNSIGDLIADVSVVKQGYPKMAMAAAIGGPLFNLLMGFGLPFTIAKLQRKYISMTINPTYRLLMLFIIISLLTTLIGIFVQRGRLQRPHAAVLMSVYVAFIVFLLLSETHVLVWN